MWAAMIGRAHCGVFRQPGNIEGMDATALLMDAAHRPVETARAVLDGISDLSCRSLVTQDVLDYCCGVGGYVGLGGDGLTGDLDGDLA